MEEAKCILASFQKEYHVSFSQGNEIKTLKNILEEVQAERTNLKKKAMV